MLACSSVSVSSSAVCCAPPPAPAPALHAASPQGAGDSRLPKPSADELSSPASVFTCIAAPPPCRFASMAAAAWRRRRRRRKTRRGKKKKKEKKTNVCARFCLRRRSTGEKVWRSRLLIGDARFGRKSRRRRRRVRLEERSARPRARQGDAPPARVLFSSDEQRNGCAVHLSSAGGCAGRLRSSQHGFATGEA